MDFKIPELIVNNEDNVLDIGEVTIKNNPPDFIRTERQIHYYEGMYDLIKANGTVMEQVDSTALGMLAINLALADDATYEIETYGFTMEVQGDRNTITKKNPALDVLKDAQSMIKFYLVQFKMTPTSRAKQLSPNGIGKGNDGFDKV